MSALCGRQTAQQSLIRVAPRSLLSRQGRKEMRQNNTKRIMKDMQKNGFDDKHPIKVFDVDGDLIIKDGHHRARAAVMAGIKEVPIDKARVTDSAMKKILRDQVLDAKLQ